MSYDFNLDTFKERFLSPLPPPTTIVAQMWLKHLTPSVGDADTFTIKALCIVSEPRVCAAFPPRRATVMSPLWKAEGSSFSDQFVCCLPLCNRGLMPFSQIVVRGGNTIICSAPADLTVGALREAPCLSSIYPPSRWQERWHAPSKWRVGRSLAGRRRRCYADDTLHYGTPVGRRSSPLANHGQCETRKHQEEWQEGKQQHILLRCCGLTVFVRVWRDVTAMFVPALFKVCSAQKAHYEVDRFSRPALIWSRGRSNGSSRLLLSA